jgi:hypothetical protein
MSQCTMQKNKIKVTTILHLKKENKIKNGRFQCVDVIKTLISKLAIYYIIYCVINNCTNYFCILYYII